MFVLAIGISKKIGETRIWNRTQAFKICD